MVTVITNLCSKNQHPASFFWVSSPSQCQEAKTFILSLWEWKTQKTYGGADGGQCLPLEHPSNSVLCFNKIHVTGLSQLQCVDISNAETWNVKSQPDQSISKHVLHTCNWHSFTRSAALSWAFTGGNLAPPKFKFMALLGCGNAHSFFLFELDLTLENAQVD